MQNIQTDDIRAQAERILASQEFMASQRLSQFIRYVVEKKLNGQQDAIKQYTVAVEGLGYGADFDPLSNPIIRVQAGKLRRALEYYYSTHGQKDPIRIIIPKGKYVPEFVKTADKMQEKEPVSKILSFRSAMTDSQSVESVGPSIAIMPYKYIGNGADYEYISTGMTEEIIIALTRFQDFFVVGPLQRDKISQKQMGARAIGQEYRVRFLLDGTVRLRDRFLRLTTKLTDTHSGRELWGQVFDYNIDNTSIQQIEEEIVGQTVTTIADNFGVIPRTMAKEIFTHHNDCLTDYAAILRFHHHVKVLTEESLSDAIKALEKVVEREPDHDLALALLGDLVSTPYWLGYTDSQGDLERAAELGKRALALNPNSQPAHMTMAINYYLKFQKVLCLEEIKHALKLNPNNANYLANSALFLMGLGDQEEGLALIDKAMRWNPHHPGWYHFVPFLYHYSQGQFKAALVDANGFNTPDYFWDPLIRTAVLGQLGQQSEADKAGEELLFLVPDFDVRGHNLIRRMVFTEELTEMLLAGLYKAGLAIKKNGLTGQSYRMNM